MHKVSLDEVMGLEQYELVRPAFIGRIIALKKQRRVPVGDRITLVFENHDTALFQIQEMMRTERIVDIDKVRQEVETYNELVPDAGQLSATMLIEITEKGSIREALVSLLGIDRCVRLEIGADLVVAAEFEGGRSKEDNLSAVQYLRFNLGAAARLAFLDVCVPVRLAIDHPRYRHATSIEGAVRAQLVRDLEAS